MTVKSTAQIRTPPACWALLSASTNAPVFTLWRIKPISSEFCVFRFLLGGLAWVLSFSQPIKSAFTCNVSSRGIHFSTTGNNKVNWIFRFGPVKKSTVGLFLQSAYSQRAVVAEAAAAFAYFGKARLDLRRGGHVHVHWGPTSRCHHLDYAVL